MSTSLRKRVRRAVVALAMLGPAAFFALFARDIEQAYRHVEQLTGLRPEHAGAGAGRTIALPGMTGLAASEATASTSGVAPPSADPLEHEADGTPSPAAEPPSRPASAAAGASGAQAHAQRPPEQAGHDQGAGPVASPAPAEAASVAAHAVGAPMVFAAPETRSEQRVEAARASPYAGTWAGDYRGDTAGALYLVVSDSGLIHGRLTPAGASRALVLSGRVDSSGSASVSIATVATGHADGQPTVVTRLSGDFRGEQASGHWFTQSARPPGTWDVSRTARNARARAAPLP